MKILLDAERNRYTGDWFVRLVVDDGKSVGELTLSDEAWRAVVLLLQGGMAHRAQLGMPVPDLSILQRVPGERTET